MENTVRQMPKGRLASLDILRGFDLFMLVCFEPIFSAWARAYNSPMLEPVLYQFSHEPWEGFRCWDMVMPLFLFMAGASMPFSLAKYAGNHKALWKKVFRRFIILFILGMICQGNLLGFDPNDIHIYVNTLQSIAAGYVITAFILTYCKGFKKQIIATIALLIIYWIPMTLCGDWTPTGNFAYKVDQAIMGRFCGDPNYTWIWSSLTFGATVMLGAFAGQIMKNAKEEKLKAARTLFIIGVGLIVIALIWSLQMPIIKHIWTCSMCLFAGGISFLLMALFYLIIDCLDIHKGLNWLKFYGMNSIVAYFIGEQINFRSAFESLGYGMQQYLGDTYYPVWINFGNYMIIFLILWFMYRQHIFIKI